MSDSPKVTVIIPLWNEEHYLVNCLNSLLATNYPYEQLEILLIDGISTDGTRKTAENYAMHYPFIRVLDNPKRIQAAALNIGFRNAQGEIILRMDAHTTYAQDYISRCVELLQSTGAANVGGVQRAVGTDYPSSAIAKAMTSRFGVGNAHFRFSKTPKWVDTVYLGAWHKRTLEAVGGFNEEWKVNEDYELNYRIRKASGKILLSPAIRCWYHARPSLGKLARQYFRYGFWRVRTVLTHPDSLCWRHLVPPGFVTALLISLGLLPFSRPWGAITPALYATASVIASLTISLRSGLKYLPILPVVFATLHLSWGFGFLVGLFKWGLTRTRTANK